MKRKLMVNGRHAIVIAVILTCGHVAKEFLWEIYPPIPKKGEWKVCFSPDERCRRFVVRHIKEAKTSIDLMGYAFTCRVIAQELKKSARRGVHIRLLLDKSNKTDRYSALGSLRKTKNIRYRIDPVEGIAHNKVMIIDQRTTITGSYNWSYSAWKKNAENILFINDPKLTRMYTNNFETRWANVHGSS